ncbi:2-acyl-glycerophospho-ethanolamine acyltransferase [Pedobacter glucosidilyticus]|uniref:Glycerol acyltransferase n=1 Tax=Pedobacter aquae TaxID=2605747 RepID=A0A5C0VK17_9SPHI|nr:MULTISPECIES: lysophospholipid acyltransferase family protein [Pedobacter]KHJ37557.1 2-acyl-glycerophospho-ethanolamine acyltransferase [Pedobacter glucosidilyticus]QEK52031.1 glycerol acyltransferase [Pedobacter aquae]
MVTPKENRLIYRFFSWYIQYIIKKDFSSFSFNKIEVDKDKAILLLANHCSWWDGFLLFYLNKIYLKKKFHVMIVEDTAKKVWFMKYLGAFSVQKQSRSVVNSLQYAAQLLENPNNLVLIFPQGQLFSNHVSSIGFEKGLLHIVQNTSKKFQYLFAVSLFDYFQNRKPSVSIYLKEWQAQEYTSLQVIKNEFNKHYDDAKSQQSKIVV